jgi:simple sugar transport system permease protein
MRSRPVLETLVAVVLSIVAGSVVLLITGHDPVEVYRALIERAVLRPAGLEETVVRATPLMITGVAVLIAVRAGIWNIGIDGQVLVAALAAAVAAALVTDAGRPVVWLTATVAGLVAGAAWALPAALLRARFGVNEIVTTIMFNYVALFLTAWLVKGPLRDRSVVSPQTELIPRELRLVSLGDTRTHAGIIVALVLVVLVGWALRRTVAGLELRVVGENPRAAAVALIPVRAYLFGALVVSGAVGGLAGANDILSTKGTFQAEWDPGYGFTAFALVFLARRSAWALVPGALLLGMLAYGADVMPRAAGIDPAFFGVIEGTLLASLAAPVLIRGLLARRTRKEVR